MDDVGETKKRVGSGFFFLEVSGNEMLPRVDTRLLDVLKSFL